MISLWRIFCLEVTALVRSWTALILLLASLGWIFAAKYLLVTDSTEEGAREMVVRYGLGGVFALLVVSVLSIATGCIASEREAKRLQLTQVRPVSPFAIAWGKFLALSALGFGDEAANKMVAEVLASSPDVKDVETIVRLSLQRKNG